MPLSYQHLTQRNLFELPVRERRQIPAALRQIKSLLLLGGSLRPSPLAAAIDRSILDLPVATGISVLQAWQLEAASLAETAELEPLTVRLLLDGESATPTRPPAIAGVELQIERDRAEYRGPGGILRDATEEYDRDDLVLVASAAQVLLRPLAEIACALGGSDADACLLSSAEGTPTNVMLIRCEALRSIPAVGFLDLKEQVLPRMAKDCQVRVVSYRRPSVPLRSLDGYIAALRSLNRPDEEPSLRDPFAEDWRSAFSIKGAKSAVGPRSRLHDSVVLDGGVVENGATLFGSVVCAGSVVRGGETVVRRVVRN